MESYYHLKRVLTEDNCEKLLKRLETVCDIEYNFYEAFHCGNFTKKTISNCELSSELIKRIRHTLRSCDIYPTIIGHRWDYKKRWPMISGRSNCFQSSVPINSKESNYYVILALNNDFKGGEIVVDGKSVSLRRGDILLIRHDTRYDVSTVLEGFQSLLCGYINLDINCYKIRTMR